MNVDANRREAALRLAMASPFEPNHVTGAMCAAMAYVDAGEIEKLCGNLLDWVVVQHSKVEMVAEKVGAKVPDEMHLLCAMAMLIQFGLYELDDNDKPIPEREATLAAHLRQGFEVLKEMTLRDKDPAGEA